jgi:hypothetical protein
VVEFIIDNFAFILGITMKYVRSANNLMLDDNFFKNMMFFLEVHWLAATYKYCHQAP